MQFSTQRTVILTKLPCFTLLAFACCVANGIEVQQDVVYGKAGESELQMDIALPADRTQPAPCIVVIHGGAWRHGNRSMHRQEIRHFTADGYVSASIQYRLCPQDRFPAQIEDVRCAIRYLRAHAKQYGIDPTRIGAIGFSAGAHLSMMLGTMMLGTMNPEDGLEGKGGWPDQSSNVQTVVSCFGPTQLDADDIPTLSIPLVTDFIGGSKQDKAEAYRQASPLTYIDRGNASMLLFQGTQNVLVPHSQAINMVTAMTQAGVPGRVEFLINAGHGWQGDELEATVEAASRFFRRYLKKPQS